MSGDIVARWLGPIAREIAAGGEKVRHGEVAGRGRGEFFVGKCFEALLELGSGVMPNGPHLKANLDYYIPEVSRALNQDRTPFSSVLLCR